MLNRNSNGDFRFSHYSIQEFLLAHSIINNQDVNFKHNYIVTGLMLQFIVSSVDEASKKHTVKCSNESLNHVDFMIGAADTKVIGYLEDGTEEIIMENGEFF